MAYSDYDKQMAIEIVHRNNDVLDSACLADIREALGTPDLPARTIRYWLKSTSGRQISVGKKEISAREISVADHVAKALDEKLEEAAHKFVDHATSQSVTKKMSGAAAMTSAAIAIDKMRLLRGLPTEIIDAMPILTKLNELFKQINTPIGNALEDYYQQMHELVQAQKGDDHD